MSTSFVSLGGTQNNPINSTQNIDDYPELPALTKVCNSIVGLVSKGIALIPCIGHILSCAINVLVEQDVLRLKKHILDAIAQGHKGIKDLVVNLFKAKGLSGKINSLLAICQWAVGKGLQGLAHISSVVLGWLLVVTKTAANHSFALLKPMFEKIQQRIKNLQQDLTIAKNFDGTKKRASLSQSKENPVPRSATIAESSVSFTHSKENETPKGTKGRAVTSSEQVTEQQIEQQLSQKNTNPPQKPLVFLNNVSDVNMGATESLSYVIAQSQALNPA